MIRTAVALLVACVVLVFSLHFYAHQVWNPVPTWTTIDRIVVEKSARRLSIFANGKELKTYRVALGRNSIGPKEQEGDMKTPEGIYKIDGRNAESSFHLALHISYPSDDDSARAAERGVSAGFDIMVHGIRNGLGWNRRLSPPARLDCRLHRADRRGNRRALARHAGRNGGRDSPLDTAGQIKLRKRARVRD